MVHYENVNHNWDSEILILRELHTDLMNDFTDILGFSTEILIKQYMEWLNLITNECKSNGLLHVFNDTYRKLNLLCLIFYFLNSFNRPFQLMIQSDRHTDRQSVMKIKTLILIV